MSIPRELVPPEITQLDRELRQVGFSAIEERYDPEIFGNALLVFALEHLLIRAVRERGDWNLGVSISGWNRWFLPHAWQGALHGSVRPDQSPNLAEQVGLTLSLLTTLLQVSHEETSSVLNALNDWQLEWFEAQRRH